MLHFSSFNLVKFCQKTEIIIGRGFKKGQLEDKSRSVTNRSTSHASNYNNLWVLNSDTADRLSLFGNAKDMTIKVVSNKAANAIKIFNSLWLHASAKFEASSIIVPSTDTDTGREMKSKLSKELFEERRGIYSAPFLKNMKTTDGTERTNELLTGENLSGYSLEITLKNDSTTKVELFQIQVLSELNY